MSMFDNNQPNSSPAEFRNPPPGYSQTPLGSRPLMPGEKPWRARGLLRVALVIVGIVALTYIL